MKMINCNECEHINFTEEQQHDIGTKEVPGHCCTVYHKRVFHGNCHSGKDSYIEPCCQCLMDGYKNFVSSEFIRFVKRVSSMELNEQQLQVLIEYFKTQNQGKELTICFPRVAGRTEMLRIIEEWKQSKTAGITAPTGIKQHRK